MAKFPFDNEHDYGPPAYSEEEIESLRIERVHLLDEYLVLLLSDSKVLCAPFAVSPALETATEIQRYQWQLVGNGQAVVWWALEVVLTLRRLLEHPDARIGEIATSD